MSYTIVELSAIIVIAMTALKVLLYIVSPTLLMDLGKMVAKNRLIMTIITGAAAAYLFLKFTAAGLSVTTLLAVFLFYGLIMMLALLPHYDDYLAFIDRKGIKTVIAESWSVYVVYLILIGLATKELFF